MADVQSPLPEATSAESKQLSSTVIEPNPSGDYTYYESGMLIPHEAIRLQFARAAKALENLDCNAHMWKAERWNEWIIFFIAMIHSHHDHEEHIFFPHYTALGAQTPKKQFADHKELMALMEEVKSASSMLKVMVERRDSSNDALNEQVQKVRELFLKLKTVTEEHLAEEETFWPNAMKMYGEEAHDEAVKKILAYGMKQPGDIFQLELCMICEAMGVEINRPIKKDSPCWAGHEIHSKVYYSGVPAPVRFLLVPGWNKKYYRYVDMILSLQGEEDTVGLAQQQAGCSCTIA